MIEVDALTKNYGPAQALKGISFRVQKGEVVGFLGPNGAGKSTTMKILTGYLLPTSGNARVDGLDVVENTLQVRRRIGYLPESTPLYGEMRVDDYLRFAAEIRGVRGKELKPSIERVIDQCGLQRVVGKNVDELSKGYRQRVGLAQAMVHDPDLLILDEPTSGLDPNQIVEVRELIARLGEEHTVILSTHYLQEVEAACSRVIVIDLGEIVADGTRDELIAAQPDGPIRARLEAPADIVRSQLAELIDGVEIRCESDEAGVGQFTISGAAATTERVAAIAAQRGWPLHELRRERASLEDAFRSLTLLRRGETTDA